MSIKQISVFLENKPGKLNEMTSLLSAHGINMRALYLSETKDFGIARIIVDNVLEATNVLRDANFIANLTSVTAFEISNEPGSLNDLLATLTELGLNIEYTYSVLGSKKPNTAYIIFRIVHHRDAEEALKAKGLRPLTQEDIANI